MAQRIPLWKLILARVLYRTWGARIAVDGCFVFLVSFPGSFHFYGEKAGAPWPIKTLFVGIVASDWLAYLSATMNVRKISYILIGRKLFWLVERVITIYEIFRQWVHHWSAKSRQKSLVDRLVDQSLALVSSVFIWTKRVNPGDELEMRTALFVDCSSISCPSCSKNFSLWG